MSDSDRSFFEAMTLPPFIQAKVIYFSIKSMEVVYIWKQLGFSFSAPLAKSRVRGKALRCI